MARDSCRVRVSLTARMCLTSLHGGSVSANPPLIPPIIPSSLFFFHPASICGQHAHNTATKKEREETTPKADSLREGRKEGVAFVRDVRTVAFHSLCTGV